MLKNIKPEVTGELKGIVSYMQGNGQFVVDWEISTESDYVFGAPRLIAGEGASWLTIEDKTVLGWSIEDYCMRGGNLRKD